MKCQACEGYGYTDGAPDAKNQGRCDDCYCEWCLKPSGEVPTKDDEGYNICGECVDYFRVKYA